MLVAERACHLKGLSFFIAFLRLAALPVPIIQGVSVEVYGDGQLSQEAAPKQAMRYQHPARGDMSDATPSRSALLKRVPQTHQDLTLESVTDVEVAALPMAISQGISVEVYGDGRLSQAATPKPAIQHQTALVKTVEVDGNGHLSQEAAPKPAIRHQHPARGGVSDGMPSRNALLKRQTEIHTVQGHLALARKSKLEPEVASGPGESPAPHIWNCTQVFDKARKLVNDAMQEKSLAGHDFSGLSGLLKSIIAKDLSQENREQFNIVLQNMSLGDAFDHEDVWTEDMLAKWVECNSNVQFLLATDNMDGEDALEDHRYIGPTEMFQGDILPISVNHTAMLLEAAVKHKRVVATSNLWPLNRDMAYCFASGVSDAAQYAVQAAVQHIQDQVPCVRFKRVNTKSSQNKFANTVKQSCTEIPSMIFQSQSAGCWSAVGLVSGVAQYHSSSQPINIGAGCEDLGIAAHEIGHTIGLLHEMSRTDRQSYLKVNSENIPPDMIHNFAVDAEADTVGKFDFDFLSLMMYGSFAFTNNGQLTIAPNDLRLVNYMGQRMGFSELDIQLIGDTYGCLSTITPKTKNAALSKAYLSRNGHAAFEGNCTNSTTTPYVNSDGSTMTCPQLQPYCSEDSIAAEIRQLCPVSCYLCGPGIGNAPQDAAQAAAQDAAPDKAQDAAEENSGKSAAEYVCGRPHLCGHLLVIFTWLVACAA